MVVPSIGPAQPRRRGGGSRHLTAREACVRGEVDRLWNSSAAPSAWEITLEEGVHVLVRIVRLSPPVPSRGTSARDGAVGLHVRPGWSVRPPNQPPIRAWLLDRTLGPSPRYTADGPYSRQKTQPCTRPHTP